MMERDRPHCNRQSQSDAAGSAIARGVDAEERREDRLLRCLLPGLAPGGMARTDDAQPAPRSGKKPPKVALPPILLNCQPDDVENIGDAPGSLLIIYPRHRRTDFADARGGS